MKTKLISLLSIMILQMTCMSCKKDDLVPIQSETRIHYQLTSTRQHDEATDIYLYTNTTTGVQKVSMITVDNMVVRLPLHMTADDARFPTLGISLTGDILVSGNRLILSYIEWNLIAKTTRYSITGATYIRVP